MWLYMKKKSGAYDNRVVLFKPEMWTEEAYYANEKQAGG